MKYAIYTFRFTTPVHFGSAELGGKLEQVGIEYTSDSLFSAICWELRQLGELDYLQSFCEAVKQGKLLFSDLFPYHIDTQEDTCHLYIPKPVALIESEMVLQTPVSLEEVRQQATARKKQKKMKYLRPSELKPYINALKQSVTYASSLELGEQSLVERVNCRGEEPLPYYVGTYTFRENTGLYVLVQYTDDIDLGILQQVFTSLGQSGIGGKRSSGLGKFIVVDEEPLLLEDEEGIYGDDGALYAMLCNTSSSQQMSLSTIIPAENEIPIVAKGQYMLRRRSGFTTGAGELKKRNSVYTLRAGSCFSHPLAGTIAVLDDSIEPPIWRNGKGIFVGLSV